MGNKEQQKRKGKKRRKKNKRKFMDVKVNMWAVDVMEEDAEEKKRKE